MNDYSTLPQDLKPPVNCPYCDTKLTIEGDYPICSNYLCTMRVYGRLRKYVETLNIKGVGEEILKQMVQAGYVKTPADLYIMTLEQYKSLDRVGEKHYQKLKSGLEATKAMTTAQFLAALDIEGVTTWENICAVPGLQTLDQILVTAEKNPQFLAKAIRVSPERANAIAKEVNRKLADIIMLRPLVTFKTTGDKLQGKTFCITGSLSEPRPNVERKIKDAGGQVSSSVTKRTTHLLCNEPSSSTKSKKAKELGVITINEDQLNGMLR